MSGSSIFLKLITKSQMSEIHAVSWIALEYDPEKIHELLRFVEPVSMAFLQQIIKELNEIGLNRPFLTLELSSEQLGDEEVSKIAF